MKKHHCRFAFLVCPLLASALLSSCVDPGYATYNRQSSGDSRHSVYSTLPSSFVGDAYFHNGQYYSGGNYETGRYLNGGNRYSNRYYHNGQYIYGGSYKTYDSSRRHDHRDGDRSGTRNRR
jgi:hypothetical protein